MASNFDIYAVIADRIITEMEKGVIPWEQPWVSVTGSAVKHRNGKPYSLLNQILLGEKGEYMSYRECIEVGGKIRKGAKGRMVVFWKWIETEKTDESGHFICGDNGLPLMTKIPYLRYSNVFHIRDCEGVKPKWDKEAELFVNTPDERAEKAMTEYIAREGITFRNEKQDRAFYRPSEDLIVLPLREQFKDVSEYYSTAFHEATHSTGHSKRLARFDDDAKVAAFGREDYSKEELVAEIGSAAILHQLGIETKCSFRNSTAYIQNWLKALKDDKRLIVSAAGRADKAARFILGIEPAISDGYEHGAE